jgi:LysM repeat protein
VADASGAQQESDASSSSEEEEATGGEKTRAYYVVKRGDSLWGIAQKNGLSVAKLKELNELSSSDLMPGDRLRVE